MRERTPPRHGDWLAADPLLKAGWAVAAAVYVVAAAGWIARSRDLIGRDLEPFGHDFLAFWSASHVALNGAPANAYAIEHIVAAHHVAYPALSGFFPWIYPPTFLLVVLPLALLPHVVAYAAFVGVTFCGYLAVLRRIAPTAAAVALIAVAPATFTNAAHGQNGFLTAALLGAAFLLADRRPALAGVAIGLLAFKPHWALMLPLALAVSGRWRTLAAAGATAFVFFAVSAAVLGIDSFEGFWRTVPLMRRVTEDGLIPWAYMPTVFSAVRLAGGSVAAAYVLQAVATAAAAAAVAWLWRQPTPIGLLGAATIAATALATPYLFDYDLVALGIAVGLLMREALRSGFLPGERAVVLFAWIVPIGGTALAEATAVQVGPVVSAAIVAMVVRRVYLGRARHPVAGPTAVTWA